MLTNLAQCTTPELKAQIKREWGTYRLAALSKNLADFMPSVTPQVDGEGKRTLPAMELRRTFWENHASKEFPLLAKAATRLLSMHVTTCSSERNWSIWGKVYTKDRNRLGLSLGEKIVFIRGNLQQPSFKGDEVLVAELFIHD